MLRSSMDAQLSFRSLSDIHAFIDTLSPLLADFTEPFLAEGCPIRFHLRPDLLKLVPYFSCRHGVITVSRSTAQFSRVESALEMCRVQFFSRYRGAGGILVVRTDVVSERWQWG